MAFDLFCRYLIYIFRVVQFVIVKLMTTVRNHVSQSMFLFGLIITTAHGLYSLFSEYNCRGTLSPDDTNKKWEVNVVSVARMNDVHILVEMIEIRDSFLIKVLHLSQGYERHNRSFNRTLTYIRVAMMCEIKRFYSRCCLKFQVAKKVITGKPAMAVVGNLRNTPYLDQMLK